MYEIFAIDKNDYLSIIYRIISINLSYKSSRLSKYNRAVIQSFTLHFMNTYINIINKYHIFILIVTNINTFELVTR